MTDSAQDFVARQLDQAQGKVALPIGTKQAIVRMDYEDSIPIRVADKNGATWELHDVHIEGSPIAKLIPSYAKLT